MQRTESENLLGHKALQLKKPSTELSQSSLFYNKNGLRIKSSSENLVQSGTSLEFSKPEDYRTDRAKKNVSLVPIEQYLSDKKKQKGESEQVVESSNILSKRKLRAFFHNKSNSLTKIQLENEVLQQNPVLFRNFETQPDDIEETKPEPRLKKFFRNNKIRYSKKYQEDNQNHQQQAAKMLRTENSVQQQEQKKEIKLSLTALNNFENNNKQEEKRQVMSLNRRKRTIKLPEMQETSEAKDYALNKYENEQKNEKEIQVVNEQVKQQEKEKENEKGTEKEKENEKKGIEKEKENEINKEKVGNIIKLRRLNLQEKKQSKPQANQSAIASQQKFYYNHNENKHSNHLLRKDEQNFQEKENQKPALNGNFITDPNRVYQGTVENLQQQYFSSQRPQPNQQQLQQPEYASYHYVPQLPKLYFGNNQLLINNQLQQVSLVRPQFQSPQQYLLSQKINANNYLQYQYPYADSVVSQSQVIQKQPSLDSTDISTSRKNSNFSYSDNLSFLSKASNIKLFHKKNNNLSKRSKKQVSFKETLQIVDVGNGTKTDGRLQKGDESSFESDLEYL